MNALQAIKRDFSIDRNALTDNAQNHLAPGVGVQNDMGLFPKNRGFLQKKRVFYRKKPGFPLAISTQKEKEREKERKGKRNKNKKKKNKKKKNKKKNKKKKKKKKNLEVEKIKWDKNNRQQKKITNYVPPSTKRFKPFAGAGRGVKRRRFTL
jgi:hypothetical protein